MSSTDSFIQILASEQFSLQPTWYFLPLSTDKMSNKPSEREGKNVDLKQQKGMVSWCVGQRKACREAEGLL